MPNTNLTQTCLKELLHYCPDSGVFTWRIKRKNVNPGDVAGCVRADTMNPYRVIQVCGRTHGAHRLAWLYMTGAWPDDQIDHINHNKSDNRFCNLREVDTVNNARNRKKPANNTSGCIGVNWHKSNKGWQAKITTRGKHVFLGLYKDINDAVAARKKAEIRYGFHRNHGSDSPC